MNPFADAHILHICSIMLSSLVGSFGAWWTNFIKGNDVNIKMLRKIFGKNRSEVACRWLDVLFNVPFGGAIGYAVYSPHDITRAFFAGVTWNVAFKAISSPSKTSTKEKPGALEN